MAVTNVTSRPEVEDPDKLPSDVAVLIRRSASKSPDNDCQQPTTTGGTPSKQPRRKLSKVMSRRSSLSFNDMENAEEFLDKRSMTPTQERINALTMIPGMLYSLYFLIAGKWIVPMDDQHFQFLQTDTSVWADMARETFGSEHTLTEGFGCINSDVFPNMPALPPLPVFAAAFGLLAHSPLSMLYHWKYATTIHQSKRIQHWSRRLDNAMIHFASACAAYATTGSLTYFILNAIFNLDCAYRQFEEKIQPKRNLFRTASGIFLYTMPILLHGNFMLYFQLSTMFGAAIWFFATYPIGGWSHAAFHICQSFLPYLIMSAAMRLESSQIQISLALRCADMASQK